MMEPQYETHFTAFVDFLGFSEVSTKTDDITRSKVLSLLLSLSALRGEFHVESTSQENGKTSHIKPAISTFSDHIVISYPLDPIYADTDFDEHTTAFFIMGQFTKLLTSIAAAALHIGFLVRGGATIGKLYHAQGVVFGEALVEAVQLESRTSVYPRIVLSPQITDRPAWIDHHQHVAKDSDGLYHVDYFKELLLGSAPPGSAYGAGVRSWLTDAGIVISRNLTELRRTGELTALSKWTWFARRFQTGLEKQNPKLLEAMGISLETIPWFQ
jgi:hypothetical protein